MYTFSLFLYQQNSFLWERGKQQGKNVTQNALKELSVQSNQNERERKKISFLPTLYLWIFTTQQHLTWVCGKKENK